MTATRPKSYLTGDTGTWNGQTVTITGRINRRMAGYSRQHYVELTIRFPDGSSTFITEGRFRAAQPKPKAELAPRRWSVRDVARWELRTAVEMVRRGESYRPGIGYTYAERPVATVTVVGPDGREEEVAGEGFLGAQTYLTSISDRAVFGLDLTPAAFAELDRRVDEAIKTAIAGTI